MSTLIIFVLFGLGFAYFATQNTAFIEVNIAQNLFRLPLYMLVGISFLAGLLIAGVVYVMNNIVSSMTIYSKDSKIKEKQQTVEELAEKVHQLELENSNLKGHDKEEIVINQSRPKESTLKQVLRKVGIHDHAVS